jgi:O-antigen/teichoic acid export membrane protein
LIVALRKTAPLRTVFASQADQTEISRKLRVLNRASIVSTLFGRLCLLTDNIIIGLFLGPAAVVPFFLTTRLTQAASGQVQAVGAATWAGLAQLVQSGEIELFHRRLVEVTKITAILAGAVVVPLAALTGPFVSLWVGPDRYAGDLVAGLCVFNTVVLAVYSLWGWVFTGTGRLPRLLPFLVGQAAINFGVSLLATWWFGLPGPLIGTAVVNIVYNPRIAGILRSEFGGSVRLLFSAVFTAMVPALVLLVVLFAVRQCWPVYTWWRFFGELGAAACLYLALAWCVILRGEERELFLRLVRRKATPA